FSTRQRNSACGNGVVAEAGNTRTTCRRWRTNFREVAISEVIPTSHDDLTTTRRRTVLLLCCREVISSVHYECFLLGDIRGQATNAAVCVLPIDVVAYKGTAWWLQVQLGK